MRNFVTLSTATVIALSSVFLHGAATLPALPGLLPQVISLSGAPAIVTQPRGGQVDVFGTYSLSVNATGTAPLSYQWKLNGNPITGANASTYFANGSGSYSVSVTNASGTTDSTIAVVRSDDAPNAMRPFAIPINTPAGAFPDLRSWNTKPAGSEGKVTVGSDGHFQVGGHRIRFFGADIVSENNFPSFPEADIHAQRLARFGFNSVRLHYNDQYWPWDTGRPGSLIVLNDNSSEIFNQDALRRMHYFMARCADVGIYSNVNLCGARKFQKNDGLGAEIDQMKWARQHLLSFFDERMVSLQKAYAEWLLNTPNEFRNNMPLARDPAVCIVEIMNETGLADGWVNGDLALIPAVYTDKLQTLWIQWLKTRYNNSQAAMYHGWYAADEPLGANILADVNAPVSSQGWYVYQSIQNNVTTEVTQDYNGSPCRRINVKTPGIPSSVQLLHKDLTLTEHQVYTISFRAKVESPEKVHKLKIYLGRPNYADLCDPIDIQGTDWKLYTRTFVMRTTEESSRIGFSLGATGGTTWITDVQLRPGGTVGILPPGVTLANENIPALLTNNPSDYFGMREDWVRFLSHREKTYWNGMRDYVRSLGFESVIVGTIVRNSPPNSQAGMDAMDTHSYYNYPDLHDGYINLTDLTDWTMEHKAIVNNPQSNEIVYSAVRAIKGYPNIMTEFEHPAPNLYAGEQEFFYPSYAALQDMDGYWVYSYTTRDRPHIKDHFDSMNSMNKLANIAIAAALFRRDVSPAQNEYVMAMTPDREATEIVRRASHFSMPHAIFLGMPQTVALISRIRMSIGENATGLATPPATPAGPVYVSDTGQLRWDVTNPTAGVFTVNTPRTRVFSGFGSGKRVQLGDVAITTGSTRLNWSTIGVTLLEGNTFTGATPARALIVATGQYANSNWKWKNANHNGLSTWGGAPFLVEVVSGEVELPVSASRVRAWALSGEGLRTWPIPVTDKAGRAVLSLGTVGNTLWYEAQISPTPYSNQVPVLTSVGNRNATAGQPIRITVQATDGDNQPLEYSATSGM